MCLEELKSRSREIRISDECVYDHKKEHLRVDQHFSASKWTVALKVCHHEAETNVFLFKCHPFFTNLPQICRHFRKKKRLIFFCFGLKKPTVVTFQPKITFCQKKVWAFGKPLFVFSVFGFAIPVRARESRPSVMTTKLKTLWSCVERYREKIGRKKYRTDNFLQFENTGHGDLIYNIFLPYIAFILHTPI